MAERSISRRPAGRTSVALPLDGGPVRQVADCVLGRAYDVGRGGVYYVGCPGEEREAPLYLLDPATGRRRLLGKLEGASTAGLAVSPLGQPILFTKAILGADVVMIENFR